ncbi:tripartite tricarboxylate transporter substrate binding protein [Diaphorobacter aerolatus]|uniref:Tripartite tricarboxylate transporter substrate binding protein n=1 Tax=Diaphorobacter aerolatus TaxID=1288495 RepID=A0A7H0GLH3_9BURK|nr:tripartite tricarboxylate transporter substrate binding protein [Diaphorobacter aerolatus]QNP49139.1 tripartite tricarboxylate transporter substrate binding protein [Diaphorobacter aerolatus]
MHSWTSASQRWPADGVRIVVAYPTGGVSDLVARSLARQWSEQLKVPVLVENRPGAGGTLALDLLARSPPTGRTLVFTASAALAAMRDAELRRSVGKSVTPLPVVPVAGVMRTPLLLVGTPALEGTTLADMVDYARSHPGQLRWATTGEGTTGHAVLERISRQANVHIIHVPYKGGGQQLTDALGGHFEVLSTNVASQQLNALREGRFKALAVGAPQRLPLLADVPTLAELGYAQANLDSLFGLFAAKGTPVDLVEQINQSVEQALRSSTIRDRLLEANNQPFMGTAQDFAEQVEREANR